MDDKSERHGNASRTRTRTVCGALLAVVSVAAWIVSCSGSNPGPTATQQWEPPTAQWDSLCARQELAGGATVVAFRAGSLTTDELVALGADMWPMAYYVEDGVASPGYIAHIADIGWFQAPDALPLRWSLLTNELTIWSDADSQTLSLIADCVDRHGSRITATTQLGDSVVVTSVELLLGAQRLHLPPCYALREEFAAYTDELGPHVSLVRLIPLALVLQPQTF
jgi:hypothetical protein